MSRIEFRWGCWPSVWKNLMTSWPLLGKITLKFLPRAYVVRREGNVLTRVCPSVCPQGGYPYPIMLCNISQNAMGQTPGGGYPARSSRGGGGYPARSSRGGGGVPCQVQLGGGTLLGGYSGREPPPARSGWEGGYPVRTTEGVVTTRQAVCLLRSCRRTFLLRYFNFNTNLFANIW